MFSLAASISHLIEGFSVPEMKNRLNFIPHPAKRNTKNIFLHTICETFQNGNERNGKNFVFFLLGQWLINRGCFVYWMTIPLRLSKKKSTRGRNWKKKNSWGKVERKQNTTWFRFTNNNNGIL